MNAARAAALSGLALLAGIPWLGAAPSASFPVRLEKDLPARMRDGVVLRADVLRPEAPGRFPAILYRTPYGKEDAWRESDFLLAAARAGYVVVVQDVRGRYRSEGEFDPYRQEGADGYDSVEWVAELPYVDGKVGMAGLSYPGAVQWLAAVAAPPHLAAIAPAMCFATGREFFYFGGAFDLSWIPWTHNNIAPDRRVRLDLPGPRTEAEAREAWRENRDRWMRHLPLLTLPVLKDVAPFYYQWLEHPDDGPYWSFADVASQYPRVQVPALNLSGWHDEGYGPGGAIRNFEGTRARGSRLIIGPWTHGAPSLRSMSEGELDFGPNAGLDYQELILRWFDRWLKGIDNDVDREPPVRIFVMGDNRWREESDWPLARARPATYYLASGHRLMAEPPSGEEAPDRYRYDPRDPVVDPRGGELGPFDQSPLESRPDVLAYSTEPLPRDTEVTGPIEAELWVSSSAPDTDFFVRLLDVHPDGRAYNLMSPTLEVLRARYRHDEGKPEPLVPHRVELLRFRRMVTSNVFKAGHRIRIHVTSSLYPHLDRNPNAGGPVASEVHPVAADQAVYHDSDHPSRVVLPVIPR